MGDYYGVILIGISYRRFIRVSFLLRSTLMNINQLLIQNISLEIIDYENRALMSSVVSCHLM